MKRALEESSKKCYWCNREFSDLRRTSVFALEGTVKCCKNCHDDFSKSTKNSVVLRVFDPILMSSLISTGHQFTKAKVCCLTASRVNIPAFCDSWRCIYQGCGCWRVSNL
jgi:hypothetical protein